MQIKKEILSLCSLILLCVLLIFAVSSSKEAPRDCKTTSPQNKTCCQDQPKTSTPAPWNFITQGILHLIA